jgi:hypothetical protein
MGTNGLGCYIWRDCYCGHVVAMALPSDSLNSISRRPQATSRLIHLDRPAVISNRGGLGFYSVPPHTWRRRRPHTFMLDCGLCGTRGRDETELVSNPSKKRSRCPLVTARGAFVFGGYYLRFPSIPCIRRYSEARHQQTRCQPAIVCDFQNVQLLQRRLSIL